ncbi:MAG: HAD family phosphatase [Candidatus Limiplasma sp.]|nr:HAD family phosphatase [Candidatus Limiplasma sp.]MEA5145244.1 HAD family phosphatase [Candidatus Limiplasma sp.]
MIRAVLFDMDGVLFDTENLGFQAMQEIAGDMGYQTDRAFYVSTLGVPNAECKHIYHRALGDAFPYERFMERFRAYFMAYNKAHTMPFKPGLLDTLAGLKARGLRLALATSTVRPLVMDYFARMPEVGQHFDVTVCGGEVPHGKPAPDIYLAAARAVDCDPADCLGVEDSFFGVQAIRAAGACCVMIPDMLPYDERFAPYVDHRLHSLHDLCPLVDALNAAEPA